MVLLQVLKKMDFNKIKLNRNTFYAYSSLINKKKKYLKFRKFYKVKYNNLNLSTVHTSIIFLRGVCFFFKKGLKRKFEVYFSKVFLTLKKKLYGRCFYFNFFFYLEKNL